MVEFSVILNNKRFGDECSINIFQKFNVFLKSNKLHITALPSKPPKRILSNKNYHGLWL